MPNSRSVTPGAAPAAIPFFRSPFCNDPEVTGRITRACADVLRSGVYVLGPQVRAFEASMSALLGAREVVAVNSGSDALCLALAALGVGTLGGGSADDEVVLPAYTFVACAEAVLAAGARPVFVDCDASGFLPSLEAHQAARGVRTRAVLAVGLFGDASALPALAAYCREQGLWLVEDIAQCLGASCTAPDGTARLAGTWGDAAAMSFYPTKTLGAVGDAGAMAFADARHARQARLLRNHGHEANEHLCLGRNSRMDELQAALLQIALETFPLALARRRQIASRYLAAWAALPRLTLPQDHEGHAWNYFVVTLESGGQRDALADALAREGVATRIYYSAPLHHHRALAPLHDGRALPRSEHLAQCSLALPLYPALNDGEIDRIIDVLPGALDQAMWAAATIAGSAPLR
ncbi:DegT/DnrJ/EryC1/StrS family aminotransferase [Hydrogenophaga sp. A37]|uniref:DegT/DnrJ/EryC1/StrS family aminotransferase n=1 Tax=Hydrogenophaga sp. A37 TaxID=1945864 RepID=UPI0009856AB8|nr:DegT/DnrJ/EryC1/StrS family aminotransferase [Hydrogenophaga sp. A37]OOG81555.1 cell wall biogenesis protein [Hydrogenophaga sp. A37]